MGPADLVPTQIESQNLGDVLIRQAGRHRQPLNRCMVTEIYIGMQRL